MLFQSTIAVLALFIAATSAAPAVDSPAQALKGREFLANIDVEKACDQQYSVPTFADRKGGGCNDWRCFEMVREDKPLGTTEEFTVDMDKFCKDNFGSTARAQCGGNVFDWQCHN